jgi:putative PIN family toxin of toxin-antitoxin system
MISAIVAASSSLHDCRDSRDDKLSEVAVYGRAELIVTGDADLLELHPFHGVAILTPAAYLELE